VGRIDEPWRGAYLEALRLTGSPAAARRDSGAPRVDVDRLLADDQSFADDVAEAVALFQYEQVEQPIQERATKGVKRAVYWNGEVVGWETQYSDKLLLAMAKAHVDRYRDRLEVKGLPAAAPLDLDGLSPEGQERLRELLLGELARREEREPDAPGSGAG
jgi:hypothetical protein